MSFCDVLHSGSVILLCSLCSAMNDTLQLFNNAAGSGNKKCLRLGAGKRCYAKRCHVVFP